MRKPPHNPEDLLDNEDGLDEEDEDPYRDEIIGVEAPTIDLEQVGISRGLAMVLGPEGTRNVILGAMLRGIGRVLHPDISDIEGAAAAFTTINSAITAIERLTDKQWLEVYRRFITRRDDVMSRLQASEESAASLRAMLSDRDAAVADLETRLGKKIARAADTASLNAAMSLFCSGITRPIQRLAREGDSPVHLSEALNCVVLNVFEIHYVQRPGRVATASFTPDEAESNQAEAAIIRSRQEGEQLDRAAIDAVEHKVIQDHAAKYRRQSGNRGIFAVTPGALLPRVIAGCYSGKIVGEGQSKVVAFEDCPAVLRDCQPILEVGGHLLIASPAISGRGKPTGIQFQNYGDICSVFGPYDITEARVTGPHIKEEK